MNQERILPGIWPSTLLALVLLAGTCAAPSAAATASPSQRTRKIAQAAALDSISTGSARHLDGTSITWYTYCTWIAKAKGP